uniref:Uncharacterized protein n=1 Tax=Ixodes ricinus TaxID=34613 RepID=A0A6B0UQR8_IXORI
MTVAYPQTCTDTGIKYPPCTVADKERTEGCLFRMPGLQHAPVALHLALAAGACSRLGGRSVFGGSKLALEAVQPKPFPAVLILSATIEPSFHISRISTRHEQFMTPTRQRHGHPTCITICHMVVVH